MSVSALFGAPWDQKLTMLTILFSTLMLGSTGLVVWLALTRVPAAPIRLLMILGAVVPVAAFVIAAMMGPRGYAIADGRLRIDRLIRPIEIRLSSIRSVEGRSGRSARGASSATTEPSGTKSWGSTGCTPRGATATSWCAPIALTC